MLSKIQSDTADRRVAANIGLANMTDEVVQCNICVKVRNTGLGF
jgi:hypothetical protein